MERIVQALEQISLLPEAFLDFSVGQGRNKFLKDLSYITDGNKEAMVDKAMQGIHEHIAEVKNWLLPYKLPPDYMLFLTHYGGLHIETKHSVLHSLGVGTEVEEKYPSIEREDVIGNLKEVAVLHVAFLDFRFGDVSPYRVYFILDLSGFIAKGAVLSVGPFQWPHPAELDEIFENPHQYTQYIEISATSFTHWIEIATQTQGHFGYLDT